MSTMTITRTASAPGLSLCRCFCRHYATLTGEGLCASARPDNTPDKDGQDD